MSHITTVKATQFHDIEALKKAITDLGCEAIEKGDARFYMGVSPCDLVMRLPGRYDLGFNVTSEGITMNCDSELLIPGHVRGVEGQRVIGAADGEVGGLLRQAYAAAVLEMNFSQQGLSVTREIDAQTGEMLVVVET